MQINMEFLGTEPIENVVTCLNYDVDEVIYFGYKDIIEKQKQNLEKFLIKYCKVQKVSFIEVPKTDLQLILQKMKQTIDIAKEAGVEIFFDVTGGEGILLLAFGMLAKDIQASMHLYDFEENHFVKIDNGNNSSICDKARQQNTNFDIPKYIELYGGCINNRLHKDIKERIDSGYEKEVLDLWKTYLENREYWNPFSDFIRKNMPSSGLYVKESTEKINHLLSKSVNALNSPQKFKHILNSLKEGGFITKVKCDEKVYSFEFKDHIVKELLWESGSVLELITYIEERNHSDDCRVGVHIDWDGIIHNESGVDVLNEIDVMTLTDYTPKFISCKSGKMGSQQVLHALYELDTVDRRFGGKYSKKELVVVEELPEVYRERAKEMGVRVVDVKPK